MTVRLRAGLHSIPFDQFGKGPDGILGHHPWHATVQVPQLSTLASWLTQAAATDTLLWLRFSGNPGVWTELDSNGDTVFNQDKYEANVNKFIGFPGLQDAIDARLVQAYTMDEPFLASNGNISNSVCNQLGLYHKTFFPGIITSQRTIASSMLPLPPGGWTGIDYGWAHWNHAATTTGQTKRQWFDDQRAQLAAIGCGMIPSSNWLLGGDGRLWDYLNTGSSSGRVVGDRAGTWLLAPDEIKELADACFDDAQAPGYGGFRFLVSGEIDDQYLPYQNRQDFINARNYAQDKFETRPSFSGYIAKSIGGGGGGVGEIDHTFSLPVTARQTTKSGTYADIPGASILAAGLTPGKKYLFIASGAIDLATITGVEGFVRVVSGTSQLFASESAFHPATSPTFRSPYFWWGVKTAVAGEDIKMQFKNSDGVTTIGAQFCCLSAFNLTDDLIDGTDFKFNEQVTQSTLTTSPQDGAALTFTPQTAGHNWLILTRANYSSLPTTASVVSRLRRGGEAIETEPEVQAEGLDARDIYRFCTAKVLQLGAVTNTFAEQSRVTVGTGTRESSGVFALRLNRFKDHGFSYVSGETDVVQTPDYGTNLASVSFPLTADADVFALASTGFVPQQAGVPIRARFQLNAADNPTGQTASLNKYQHAYDAADVTPVVLQGYIESATVGSLSAELDASTNAVAQVGRGGRGSLAVAFSMKLAVAAPGTATFGRSSDGLGTRTGTRKLR